MAVGVSAASARLLEFRVAYVLLVLRVRVCSSGSQTFGQLQRDQNAIRDAVTRGTAVNSSMLAFVIVISIITAIVLFCYMKGGSRGK